MAEPQVTVSIDSSPPERTPDGGWKFQMWAVAQRSRGNPLAGQQVEFFVNNEKVHQIQTNDDGRTPRYECVVAVGTPAVNAEAQPAGDATRRAGKPVRWEGTAPKPAKIQYFVRREAGYWTIAVRILEENGNPVQGEPILVHDPDDFRVLFALDTVTNRYGQVTFRNAPGGAKTIVVMARGIQETIRLGTPPNYEPRMPYDIPPETELVTDTIPAYIP